MGHASSRKVTSKASSAYSAHQSLLFVIGQDCVTKENLERGDEYKTTGDVNDFTMWN